jgi:tRNA/rRNA methyltransferase
MNSLLPISQSDRLLVVLVSPRNPLNIGAAARAMANFGFRHLAIVSPFAVNWSEAKSAVGAPDLLRHAQVYDSLADALATCTFVLGTGSLDKRRPTLPILSLPLGADRLRHALAQPDTTNTPTAAILVGSEKHGLTTQDLSFCHGLIAIDTADAQPSMNLGQAVAVCLYEISRDPDAQPSPFNRPLSPTLPTPTGPQPNTAQLERLSSLIAETMDQVHYTTRGQREANNEALRVLLRRIMPQEADLRRIMGLFRRILWQLARIPANK